MYSIDQKLLKSFIENALHEDGYEADHTSLASIPAESISRAKLYTKDDGVIAGVAVAEAIFNYVDAGAVIELVKNDGDEVSYRDTILYAECNTRAFMKAQRIILNIMKHLSGIATLSSRFAFEVEGLPVRLLATRKTTPLLRFLEYWALRVGGCDYLRTGLNDGIVITDNHIHASSSIAEAIDHVNQYLKEQKLNLDITIEVANLVELQQVLDHGGVSRIVLDHFELPILSEAVAHVNGRFEVGASGGVTLKNVRNIAETGVDFISVAALTQIMGTLDLSFKISKH